MPTKYIKCDLMFKFNKNFIKKIFSQLSIKFKNSTRASHFLEIPRPTFYAYKNGYVSSLPKNLIIKIMKLKIISEEEIQKNKILEYHRTEQNQDILKKGREFRKHQLKKWKSEIPRLSKILYNDALDFERWFLSYQKLINFGARKFNYVRSKKDYLEINYITHSNKKKKEFIIKIPKKISIDEDFLYFFGLWVGDKAGGKRFGIMNKEKKIVSFTKYYLTKLYQDSMVVLYIAQKQKLPKEGVKYSKIVRISNKDNGYAYSTHAINGVLVSFFNYLESNLDEFFNLTRETNIFFAGLFDAEGNIFLEDSCFRWSCRNERLIKIFKEHLKKMGLFDRFDGVNLISYSKESFAKKILPYLKHTKKINNSNLAVYKKGNLEKRFTDILTIIENKGGISSKELAKVLNRKKIYAQVRFLKGLGYVHTEGYPQRIFINKNYIK